MVTCPKCGTTNPDDASFCTNCGSVLNVMEGERKRGDTCFGQRERLEDECFGLPHGRAIVGLFFGAIIIIIGLGNLFGWSIDLGPLAMIMFGILIIAGAIYGLTQRR